MTVYLLMGFSRALEFKVDFPKEMTVKAWAHVKSWLDRDLQSMMSHEKTTVEESGDFFHVTRTYFKRERAASTWQLKPIDEGATLSVGDQVEVHLSLQSKHAAEYVHLQDPRAAGLEPETLNSGYKWDLGLSWYEETRDSGSNFFFSQLPGGEYSFKSRLRANMAGTFRVGPAIVQSIYAPEFNAYLQGSVLTIVLAK